MARLPVNPLEQLRERLTASVVKLSPQKKPLPDHPWTFVLDCCFTFDELARAQGLDPKRRFPAKEFLRVIAFDWYVEKLLRVEKSRQIMVTWLLAALWLWLVLKFPGQRVAWICKTLTDASDHLRSRVLWMYENIPVEYDKPVARMVGDDFLVFHDPDTSIATSRIQSIASEKGRQTDAASQLRSFTFSGINWDETAFQAGQDESYAAGLACVGSVGRFTATSTANGKNFFWRLGHGNIDEAEANQVQNDVAITKEQLLRGVLAWRHNGFRNLRVHYTADPDKDPQTDEGRTWFDTVRRRYSTRKWNREMEIDFSVPAGVPVFCDTEKIVEKAQSFKPWLKVFRGWDFGFLNPYVVFKQVEPIVDEKTGKVVRRIVHCLKEVHVQNILIQAFAENYVLPLSHRLFPGAVFEDFGDPAGHQRSDKSPLTSIQVLAALGIAVRTSASEVDPRIDMVQDIISAGDMEIDPLGCPKLLAAVKGGYYRDEKGQPVKDGISDHPCDALGYGILNLFGLKSAHKEGTPTVHHPTPLPMPVQPIDPKAPKRYQPHERVRIPPKHTSPSLRRPGRVGDKPL